MPLPPRAPMTSRGKQKLEDELNHLIRVEREAIKKALAEARAMGDLSENAEYSYAKEKQSLIEGRILELQAKIANAEVIDVGKIKSDKIVFGATVTLIDTDTDQVATYQIVGDDEAAPAQGKIALHGALAQALMGKEAGDEFTFKTPKGEIDYEIQSFCFKAEGH